MSSEDAQAPHDLPLLIGAGGGEPEILMLVGSVRDGHVTVRRWSGDNWSASAESRTEDATALLQWIETQAARGRTLNQELYAVRLWLRGNRTTTGTR